MSSAELQHGLERSLKRRLNVSASPEYGLTWKRWDMESGPPICALRAAVRRTSGSGSTGWPTPTACEQNQGTTRGGTGGLPLHQVAQLTGWPTPMAGTPAQKGYNEAGNNDSSRRTVELVAGWPTPNAMTGGQTSRGGDRKGEKLLGGLVRGATASSSPAPTGKRGVLNPRFSLWLMGYPEEWASCGERAMRLFPRRRKRSSRRTWMLIGSTVGG